MVHWIVPILHLTCNTGRPGGGGELVFWQAGEVVGVHVVVGHQTIVPSSSGALIRQYFSML